MAGLLDFLPEDPNQREAITQGLLAGIFGAMAGRGSRTQALGQGGLAGLMGYSGAIQGQQERSQLAQERELKALQLQQLRDTTARQSALQGLPQQFYRTPAQTALAGGGGPTTANAQRMETAAPSFDFPGYAQALAQYDPAAALQLQASLQREEKPLMVPEGTTVLNPRTLQPMFNAPKRDDDPFLRLMRASGIDPTSPRGQELLAKRLERESTRAPGVTVNYGQPVAGVDAQGNPVFFQVPKGGGAPSILPGVAPPEKAKPATEFQEKAGLYFKSMQQASQTLDKLETGPGGRVSLEESMIPNETGRNVVRSPARRQYVQGQKQWIDSINRVRSGANLPELEYDRAVMTFFPQYGDDTTTIEQKRIARQQEETAMRSAAGPAIKEPKAKTVTVDY